MLIKVKPNVDNSEPFELKEHEGPVLRIDLSVNGLLASYSGDGTIKIWNLEERKAIKTIEGFTKIKSHIMTDRYGESRLNWQLSLIAAWESHFYCFL